MRNLREGISGIQRTVQRWRDRLEALPGVSGEKESGTQVIPEAEADRKVMAPQKPTRIGPDRQIVTDAITLADKMGCSLVADALEWSVEHGTWVVPTDKDLPADFTIVPERKELTNGK
jgi:hypothetical protein